jgi:N-acetyltransferase
MHITHVTAATAFASLSPLVLEDRDALRLVANDPAIWTHWAKDMSAQHWDRQFDWMVGEQAAGRWLLHTVRDGEDRVIGQTCYLAIRPEHKGVEIGGTWYASATHSSKVNPSCKLLLLDHAFASGAERVELKTNANNTRSRAAILKLGASFEGIHRHHMLQDDGTWRDTAWYSILADEWGHVKTDLEARLAVQ